MLNLEIVCNDERYLPTYAHETDACMDLKVKIEKDGEYNEEKVGIIQPNETKVFGTGVQVSIPKGYAMLIFPRSSTGFKLHCMLVNQVAVIDEDYRDEIHLGITNFGNTSVCLNDGQRVAQFMIVPKCKINLISVEDDEQFRATDRKGGIGSTGE